MKNPFKIDTPILSNGFTKVPTKICSDKSIHPIELKILLFLISSYPTHKYYKSSIITRLGIAKNTFNKYWESLIDKELIIIRDNLIIINYDNYNFQQDKIELESLEPDEGAIASEEEITGMAIPIPADSIESIIKEDKSKPTPEDNSIETDIMEAQYYDDLDS